MSAVVGCFNERAQKLLELHLASGFRKYIIWFKGKLQKNHGTLIQEGKDLVTYALINAIAIRKILKKYDKVFVTHYLKCILSLGFDCSFFLWLSFMDSLEYYHFVVRFITPSKVRHSSHKPKACILKFFRVRGSVSSWLFTSI